MHSCSGSRIVRCHSQVEEMRSQVLKKNIGVIDNHANNQNNFT